MAKPRLNPAEAREAADRVLKAATEPDYFVIRPGFAWEQTTEWNYLANLVGPQPCDTPPQLLAILRTALRAKAALCRHQTNVDTKREEARLLACASALEDAAGTFARCKLVRSDGTPWEAP